jgi:tungstate transport system permease protein
MQFILEQIREGFRLLHTDPDLHGEIQRTLRLAFEATAIALLLGAIPAYRIGVRRTRGARWGLVVANAGLGLPAVGVGILLVFLLPNVTPWGGQWYGTVDGMIAGQTVLALPIVVALGAAAIRGLPDGMIDQARAYGASGWRLALFAFREAKLGVLSAVILALGSAIAEVGAVTVLGGNNEFLTTTLSSEILNDISNTGVNPGIPAAVEHALAVLALMMVLAAFLTLVQQWGAVQRRRLSAEPPGSAEPPARRHVAPEPRTSEPALKPPW